MRAAVLYSLDQPPRYGVFPDPVPTAGEELIRMTASALGPLVRNQVSRQHHNRATDLHIVPGIDGVGSLADGRRVCFIYPSAPYGTMSEMTRVKSDQYVFVPDEIDDVSMAALAIPAMSSWAALTERAHIRDGETILINGATSRSGRLAVQIAKHLGAGKVIATGRDDVRLSSLTRIGADVVISLKQAQRELGQILRQEFERGIDIVLDYLWGGSAEQIISAKSEKGSRWARKACRFVQIGQVSGEEITLPAAALHSSGLELLGSGLGSVSLREMLNAIEAVAHAAVPADLMIHAKPISLSEVEATWQEEEVETSIVYTM